MKKRIIALAMVAILMISLVPTAMAACNHSKATWKNIRQATCGSKGQDGRWCPTCKKYVQYRAIDATGKHTYRNQTVITMPTCKTAGKGKETCTVCEKVNTYTIPAQSSLHDWAPATCTKPQTCKTCGLTTGTPSGHNGHRDCRTGNVCTRCGYVIDTQKAPHQYTASTCTAPGKCIMCGLPDPKHPNGLGHSMKNGTCSVCGYTK